MYTAEQTFTVPVEEMFQSSQGLFTRAQDTVAVGDHKRIALAPEVDMARCQRRLRRQAHKTKQLLCQTGEICS